MHASNCQNSIEAKSLPIESMDYWSVISPVTLVDIHPLARSQRRPMNTTRENRNIARSALQNRITTLRNIREEMCIFAERTVSGGSPHLLQHGLSVRRTILWLSLTMQLWERRRLWFVEWQSWIKEWYIFVFLVESRFCVQNPEGTLRIWRSEEITLRLLAFAIDIGVLHLMWLLGNLLGTWRAYL